jgi:hypothetical protein
MPNVRDNRQPHGVFTQALRRRRPAHATAVFPARVFGYCGFSSLGAGREEFSDSLREPLHILSIQLFSPGGFTLSAPLPDLAVGQTFLFGLFQRLLIDQQPLPFVPIPLRRQAIGAALISFSRLAETQCFQLRNERNVCRLGVICSLISLC